MDYKYKMVCMKCERTYRSISGIDDVCRRCQRATMQYTVTIKFTVEDEQDAYDIISELNNTENTGLATDNAQIISIETN